jgi:hypothetical protein
VFGNRYLLAWDTHFREQLLGLTSPYQESFTGLGDVLPALVLLPVGLLAFLVLCRVAALNLPVAFGITRGLRQTAPAAVALLLACYLVALVPTVAEDYRTDRQIVHVLRDELGFPEPGEDRAPSPALPGW